MMEFLSWLPAALMIEIGWTLLHFLWQGAIIAAFLHSGLPLCRSAASRHNAALAALIAMIVMPLATFALLHAHGEATNMQVLYVTGAGQDRLTLADRTVAPSETPAILWLVAFWFAGVIVLTLRALRGWYVAEDLRRRDISALPDHLLQRCHGLAQHFAIAWPVRFLQSARVKVPVVVGWFRPVVLIPAAAIAGLSPQQLDALLLHELAHIRRLDAFINLAIVASETILFYHPAVWWVTSQVRAEREHCCDDIAVAASGDAALYVEALTLMDTWRSAPSGVLAANGGRLRTRAARLLGVIPDRRNFSLVSLLGVLFVCMVLFACVTATPSGQDSIIRRIAVDGIARAEIDGQLSSFSLREGAAFDPAAADEFLRNLYESGRFSNARADFDKGTSTLSIRVIPKAAVETGLRERNIIRRITVEGVPRAEIDALLSTSSLRVGSAFDPAAIDPLMRKLFETQRFSDVAASFNLLTSTFEIFVVPKPAATTGLSIRVVDESVSSRALKGPPGADRVEVRAAPGGTAGVPIVHVPPEALPPCCVVPSVWLKREGEITGNLLTEAHAATGPNGEPVVEFTWTEQARQQFAAMTRANVGHRIAIVVNGLVVTAPVVLDEIADNKSMISGFFTQDQAAELAAAMMSSQRP